MCSIVFHINFKALKNEGFCFLTPNQGQGPGLRDEMDCEEVESMVTSSLRAIKIFIFMRDDFYPILYVYTLRGSQYILTFKVPLSLAVPGTSWKSFIVWTDASEISSYGKEATELFPGLVQVDLTVKLKHGAFVKLYTCLSELILW